MLPACMLRVWHSWPLGAKLSNERYTAEAEPSQPANSMGASKDLISSGFVFR